MKSKKSASLELAKLCFRVLDEKKAGDLRVLDVSAQSSITDYLILATATSGPHLRALRVELEKALDAAQTRIVGIDAAQESGWAVVDVFDVMVHLFLPDTRSHYGLENLWKDAVDVSLAKLKPATRVSAVERKKAPSRKKPVRK